jgi:hypothetical protein
MTMPPASANEVSGAQSEVSADRRSRVPANDCRDQKEKQGITARYQGISARVIGSNAGPEGSALVTGASLLLAG